VNQNPIISSGVYRNNLNSIYYSEANEISIRKQFRFKPGPGKISG